MINIITKKKEGVGTIYKFDAFFKVYVSLKECEDIDKEVMKNIDDAIILDAKAESVKTKFGVTDSNNLSTGCKIVLSYLYMCRHKDEHYLDKVLDVTECGYNALEELFKCVEFMQDDTTIFLLRHCHRLRKCSRRDYNVNNKIFQNLEEGVRYHD